MRNATVTSRAGLHAARGRPSSRRRGSAASRSCAVRRGAAVHLRQLGAPCAALRRAAAGGCCRRRPAAAGGARSRGWSACGRWRRRDAGARAPADARQREHLQPLAVDAHLELLRRRRRRAPCSLRVAREPDPDHVLAVHREHVAEARAAARAERHARQVVVLREIVGDAEVVDVGQRRRRADRQPADLLRRRRYRSINVGDIFSTPAMLSNP